MYCRRNYDTWRDVRELAGRRSKQVEVNRVFPAGDYRDGHHLDARIRREIWGAEIRGKDGKNQIAWE